MVIKEILMVLEQMLDIFIQVTSSCLVIKLMVFWLMETGMLEKLFFLQLINGISKSW